MAEPCIPVRDIVNNLEVRQMCGRALGRRRGMRGGATPGPISRDTLITWRSTGGFPKPVKVLPGARGDEIWDARQVRAWLADR